jgi:hypothetical protein
MATEGHVRGGQDADGTRLRELSVSVRLGDGTVTERPLRQVTSGRVVSGAPWRTARSTRGQVHYPGFYWSATTGAHVSYESRLELARLLLADFDPDVTAIAAQPFLSTFGGDSGITVLSGTRFAGTATSRMIDHRHAVCQPADAREPRPPMVRICGAARVLGACYRTCPGRSGFSEGNARK